MSPLGLLVSFGTIVASLITRQNQNRPDSAMNQRFPSPSRRLASISDALWNNDNKLFVAGLALGLGTQYMYQQLLRNPYYRRLKNMLHNFWEGDAHAKERRPLRLPVSLLQLEQLLNANSGIPVEHYTPTGRIASDKNSNTTNGDHDEKSNEAPSSTSPHLASVCRLLSPDTDNASFDSSTSLHISLIVLEAHAEMPSMESSEYYEFYHVISGTGCYSQQGLIDTQPIQSGDVFVIDPLSIRWIANKAAPINNSNSSTSSNHNTHATSSDEKPSSQSTTATSTSFSSSFLTRQKKPNPLVLLRVTDGGRLYSQSRYNRFQRDPNAVPVRSSSARKGGGGTTTTSMASLLASFTGNNSASSDEDRI